MKGNGVIRRQVCDGGKKEHWENGGSKTGQCVSEVHQPIYKYTDSLQPWENPITSNCYMVLYTITDLAIDVKTIKYMTVNLYILNIHQIITPCGPLRIEGS